MKKSEKNLVTPRLFLMISFFTIFMIPKEKENSNLCEKEEKKNIFIFIYILFLLRLFSLTPWKKHLRYTC